MLEENVKNNDQLDIEELDAAVGGERPRYDCHSNHHWMAIRPVEKPRRRDGVRDFGNLYECTRCGETKIE